MTLKIIDLIKLPEVVEFEHDLLNPYNGWRDYYGALKIAAEYCNTEFISLKNFVWYHGVINPWFSNSASYLTYNLKNKNQIYFVTSEQQYQTLKKSGYIHTYKIGLPVIYVPKLALERIPNSLLIMPSHTLVGNTIFNPETMDAFLDKVLHNSKFSSNSILACLHKNDIENNHWIPNLQKRGIMYIQGAANNDQNALLRQSMLFSQFETMVTNDFGSHVAYALFFGVKVSIQDFELKINHEIDGTFNNDIKGTTFLYSSTKSEKRIYLKQFYQTVDNAVADLSLGKYLVGYEHKLTPFKMRLLFGVSTIGKLYWTFKNYKDLLYKITRL